ncbi:sensor histidine kinase [Chitinophaga filiformis]|uniref:Histidine kinase n=1 Tax=Chitinophaga filiformis TaxID=104663 RepID=A0A1G8ACH9_CHIFI|nr:histidine kinase [Chitinophaga filiformis]SDH18601.1 Histidine kinase [Chitinophaga filiformis]
MLHKPFSEKFRLLWLHFLVWVSIGIISFFSMLQADGAGRSALSACNSCVFYALIVYGNINFLYPRFYQKKKFVLYLLGAIILLVTAGLGRGYLSLYIRNETFAAAPHWLDTWSHITFLLSVSTVFILSFVFRLAMAYFTLKQQSEKILLQQSQFELRLLKAQVQPHFLFNTLNAMYYEAYMEAPRTALLIERLSDIIRYFVDQGTNEYVALATEIQFLDNYIALEKMRIKPEPEIIFHRSIDDQRKIPPMLLMTFVENIFKHGIDKISGCNKIYISLIEKEQHLIFQTRNSLNRHADPRLRQGLGLKNLRQRLTILYGKNFDLHITEETNEYFVASLKFPLT